MSECGYIYRAFAVDGRLLYVGATINPGQRLANHQSSAAWYPEVATIGLERFSSREAALAAEETAIRTEAPEYNIARTKARLSSSLTQAAETRRRNREEAARRETWEKENGWRPNGSVRCSNCNGWFNWIPKGILLPEMECETCGCVGTLAQFDTSGELVRKVA